MMSGERILVTDDSAMVRKYLSTILTNAGYEVSEAGSGFETLEKLKTQEHALLLLDLQMPEMSGFEVLRIVKSGAVVKSLPVLCITGVHTNLTDIDKLKELGAIGYINKECSPEDLLFRVQNALRS
jgi:DNA-binding response OmpR family regulator